MVPIVHTILSLFVVIFLGLLARKKGLLTKAVLGPLNKLVFYIAIPALLFREISKAPFQQYFDPRLVMGLLVPPVICFFLALAAGKLLRIHSGRLATFVQASVHGNLGYMGLAVAFYALGQVGFTKAAVMASFLILIQNFLSILILQLCSESKGRRWNPGYFLCNLLINPIILACVAGIVSSLSAMRLPAVADNVLRILSGMALPVALLLIGGSLSFSSSWRDLPETGISIFLKLILLPSLGVMIYRWFNLQAGYILPSIILLASPTATVTYVMAGELRGDKGLATTAISASTLISGLTFAGWLVLLS